MGLELSKPRQSRVLSHAPVLNLALPLLSSAPNPTLELKPENFVLALYS